MWSTIAIAIVAIVCVAVMLRLAVKFMRWMMRR